MIKTILFDVDGTIVDIQKVVLSTFKEVIKEYLNTNVNINDLAFALGIPGRDAIKHFTKNKVLINKMAKSWSEKASNRVDEDTLFNNIPETIKSLSQKGITLGIVTSKTKQEYINEVGHFGLDDYFDVIVTASDTKNHKPNPEPLNFAISKLGVDRTETFYVGDTKYDMLTANAAKVKFALANWGAHEELPEADYQLNNPINLEEIVKR